MGGSGGGEGEGLVEAGGEGGGMLEEGVGDAILGGRLLWGERERVKGEGVCFHAMRPA